MSPQSKAPQGGRGVPGTVWYALVAIVVSMLALTAFNVIYSQRQAEKRSLEAIQNLCAVVETLNSTYQQKPPTTEAGILMQQRLIDFYAKIGCDKVPSIEESDRPN